MLTVVGDTHGTSTAKLEGPVLDAVRRADVVIHTGDFLTQAVLDEFEEVSRKLIAVHGNNDSQEVCERIPAKVISRECGVRIVVVHGNDHSHTGLELLGRESGADLVVFGHSHSPQIIDAGEVYLLNPGSYAVPRQFRPAYAVIDQVNESVVGRLYGVDGEPFEECVLRGEGR